MCLVACLSHLATRDRHIICELVIHFYISEYIKGIKRQRFGDMDLIELIKSNHQQQLYL